MLKNRMARVEPTKIWTAEMETNKRIVSEGRENFENIRVPDPKYIVPKYIDSEYSRNLEREMLLLAANKERVVTYPILETYTNHMMIRYINKLK